MSFREPFSEHTSIIDRTTALMNSMEGLRIYFDPPADAIQPAQLCSLKESMLHDDVKTYLERRHPDGLYRHQHAAIEAVLKGRNTVVATRTSSGKSLIYSLPAFSNICSDQKSTSLFIFPQKALANDQLLKLTEMAEQIPTIASKLANSPRFISRYDGGVPSEDRHRVRSEAQLLLTNPDMLHLGILQHHQRHWQRFFRNLKLVAIDECHEYRGVFGTNVAYVLRRLWQICSLYDAKPRIVATSATVRDPAEHMQRLTGLPFHCVGPEQDGSVQGKRKFWIVGGDDHHHETGRKLALELAKSGLTVLAFCPSRVLAERMTARIQSMSGDWSFVKVYRSGLSSQERESIEQGLRNRSVRLVFSTTALELGIDIGSIDVVLCIGIPNSMMSLWQRSGRSARAGKEGVTILVPAETPIDSYYSQHPADLFARENEPLVLNMKNQRIICQHYTCAVQEAGGETSSLNLDSLGTEIRLIQQLRDSGKLDRDDFYRADPHKEINLRNSGEASYTLSYHEEVIGEIDAYHLLREAYRNAIYRHGGRPFRVRDVVRGKRLILLDDERSRNETTPFVTKSIRLKNLLKIADYSQLRVAVAKINVTEILSGVREKSPSGETVHNWQGNLGMPPVTLPTEGTMILIRAPLWNQWTSEIGANVLGALSSSERLISSLFPTVSGPCDSQDYSSAIEKLPTGEYALFLYDLVYDGVDLTRAAFDKTTELIERALERLDNCTCESDGGCFKCIANPLQEEVISKTSTGIILRSLHRILVAETPRIELKDDAFVDGLIPEVKPTCSSCNFVVPTTSRFCPNCGKKMES